MPKAIIDSVRGVNQTAGTGLSVFGMPITHFGDGVTYAGGDAIPKTTDVALVDATGTVTVTLDSADTIGAQKTLVITNAGTLTLKNTVGATAVIHAGTGGYPPAAVIVGDVFHCVYVAADTWHVSR